MTRVLPQVCRYPFNRRVLGRNAYANLYQFQAQLQYLKRLQRVRALVLHHRLPWSRSGSAQSCRCGRCKLTAIVLKCQHLRHPSSTIVWRHLPPPVDLDTAGRQIRGSAGELM
jgi:hypothetical protein